MTQACPTIDAVPRARFAISRSALFDWLLLIVPGAIWGTSFLLIAESLEAVGPFGVAFLRIAIGFATLSLFPAARGPIARGDFRAILLLSITWMAFPISMFPLAEQRVSSALTGMLNGSVPLFTAAVAGILARRLPQRTVVLGLIVGFAGAVAMALPQWGPGNDRVGVFLILAALASYGIAFNIAGPLQQRNGALPVIWRGLGIAMLLTAPLGIPDVLRAKWSLGPALALLSLGALSTGIAFIAFATAAGRLGATRASATSYLMPVVSLFLGVIVRDENVALLSMIGAAVCLWSAWLIRRTRESSASSPTAR